MSVYARETRSASLWKEAVLGVLCGAIVPVSVVVLLDVGVLGPALWRTYRSLGPLGGPSGGALRSALEALAAASAANTLGHLWAVRWLVVGAACLGGLMAVVHSIPARRSGARTRVTGFMVGLAALSLSLNSLLLLWQEQPARSEAIRRAVLLIRELGGESYAASLAVGLVVAAVFAVLFWVEWRVLYLGFRERSGLPPLTSLPGSSRRAADRSAFVSGRGADRYSVYRGDPTRWTPPRGLASARQAAAASSSAEEQPEGEAHGRSRVGTLMWAGGLLLLCCLAWVPLHQGYNRHAPHTSSDTVYLRPGQSDRTVWISLGRSPREILFASNVGHGLLDAELATDREATAAIRKVQGVELREAPEGSYTYATMPVDGLQPGDYYLRFHLAPLGGLPDGASVIMGDGEALVSYSLYAGGGVTFRLVAVGMAAILTLAVLCVIVLEAEAIDSLRVGENEDLMSAPRR